MVLQAKKKTTNNNKKNNTTMALSTLLVLLAVMITSAEAFYLPGVAPEDFRVGDPVSVRAVKMSSVKTQLPYEFYSVPTHCKPPGGIEYKSENFGEILRGDRVVNTMYDIRMKKDEKCKVLCGSRVLKQGESKRLNFYIENAYHVHLLVDNLPCATHFHMLGSMDKKKNDDQSSASGDLEQYERGYQLGYRKGKNDFFLNNHLRIVLRYHQTEKDSDILRVVGFEVETASIDKSQYDSIKDNNECGFKASTERKPIIPQRVDIMGGSEVMLTYSVEWRESSVAWASRWDLYLKMSDVKIHWFSIINSLVVIFFLAGILSMILLRSLRKDIAKYNQEDDPEESIEETGWKLVHGDVFRAPRNTDLLCILVGTGCQLFFMMFIIIAFAMLGMLSPAYRGALVSSSIFLYVFNGLFAGYFAGRLYKTFRGVQWKRASFLLAIFFPSVVFSGGFILNFFIWGKKSSGAVPFSTMLALVILVLGVSLPLVFVGYYFGYRKQPYSQPVRTNQIPRQVPEQVWYMSPVASTLMAGLLPFGSSFIELFFIFSAIWENQYYYLFGFLFLVFIIVIVSCSEIAVVMTYFQLCAEDYHWWWRSFVASGGCAFYVFIYSIFYFVTELDITGFVPVLLYFGYSSLISFTIWILTGTIGFYSSYFFVSKIYAAVKID